MTAAHPLHGVLYGHGHMGRLHAAALMARSDVSLTVIDPAQGKNPTPGTQPDFAIIATPTAAHGPVATPLLEAGVPCLVEKPLTVDLEAARHLATFPHLSVGHIERFNPTLIPAMRCQPQFIQAERLAPFTQRSTDVDVIADLMIHDLDLILRFMPGPIRDVRANGVGVVTDQPDIVNARIEFGEAGEENRVAVLTASRVSRTAQRMLRLIAPGEYWSLDLLNRRATQVPWGAGDLDGSTVSIPDTDPLMAQHDAFLRAVRGEGPFPCPGREAVAALVLAERIRSCLSS